jgi:hypothetical protein
VRRKPRRQQSREADDAAAARDGVDEARDESGQGEREDDQGRRELHRRPTF